MDIKTLFYLAKFAHDLEEFKSSIDKEFKATDDTSYKLSIEGLETNRQENNE